MDVFSKRARRGIFGVPTKSFWGILEEADETLLALVLWTAVATIFRMTLPCGRCFMKRSYDRSPDPLIA